jgi:predicted nucleic-acid-binding protein
MIAVDTNVLVRALVEDPAQPRQVRAARARLAQAGEVFVPQVVQVETVWVLEAAHGLRKAEVVSVLEHLQNNTAFHLQNRERFDSALAEYAAGPADFADYLILAESRSCSARLLTFDQRLLRAKDTQAP